LLFHPNNYESKTYILLVDGDAKPTMSYIYEAMDRAKEKIAENFQKQETRDKKVWKIIDTRWNLQLHKSLHAR